MEKVFFFSKLVKHTNSYLLSRRHTQGSVLQFVLLSAHFFCKLIILCLFCAVCPDGKASCSHNAVVIPPAHVALVLVNTLSIVSWTSFLPPAPGVPLFPACGAGKASYCTSLPGTLSIGQGNLVLQCHCDVQDVGASLDEMYHNLSKKKKQKPNNSFCSFAIYLTPTLNYVPASFLHGKEK